jgi:hypothetical protein
MMKKFALLLVVVLALTLATVVGATPSTYSSGFQVANQSASTATINIQYVNQSGVVANTVTDTIPGNSSKTYFPIGAAPGFNGSVVISSDQPVAAIANLLGNGFAYGASYESFSEGAPTVSLPLIMKGNSGFNTWFNVQNASSPGGADVNVSISYANTTCTETRTIKAGAAYTFNQATNTCLPTPYVGAATVTATGGNIVATVVQTGPNTLFAYNGFTGGSTNPVMPLVQANNAGYWTGIQVQNTGAASTNITVSYVPGSTGSACTQSATIAAGASATFFACSNLSVARFIGGASVTANSANQPLVAIVNQLNSAAGKGAAYNAFAPAGATSKVNFPLIMRDNSGFFTGFNVYNAGAAAANVTCTFTGTGAPAPVSGNVPAGGTLTAIQGGAGRYVGSVICSATGGSLLGVANQLGSGAGDNLFAYGGFNE